MNNLVYVNTFVFCTRMNDSEWPFLQERNRSLYVGLHCVQAAAGQVKKDCQLKVYQYNQNNSIATQGEQGITVVSAGCSEHGWFFSIFSVWRNGLSFAVVLIWLLIVMTFKRETAVCHQYNMRIYMTWENNALNYVAKGHLLIHMCQITELDQELSLVFHHIITYY